MEKLEAIGWELSYPHSSAVRDTPRGLRELRPRGGRSRWRGLYRRIGDSLVIGAIGPEAMIDPRGFRAAVEHAVQRLAAIEGD